MLKENQIQLFQTVEGSLDETDRICFDVRQPERLYPDEQGQILQTTEGSLDETNMIHMHVCQVAKHYQHKQAMDKDRAVVQMQSLYRGFRDRRQVRVLKENP